MSQPTGGQPAYGAGHSIEKEHALMSARGIGLMVLGALGTAALIGLDGQGVGATSLMVVAGLGTLTVFAVGSLSLRRGRGHRAEVARVDGLADGVEQEARGHLLRGREAELVRQIEALELRRDEALAEAAAAANAGNDSPAKTKTPGKPTLVMVASDD
jgi:hypothetical protein